MPRVGIALGSNLGDRAAYLEAARARLREVSLPGEPFLQASDYQTEPQDCPPGSPVFCNSVVEIAWEGNPSDLLEITQSIERGLGRTPAPKRNVPRVIDLDLLYFGEQIVESDRLQLPHPRIAERRFVLEPLAEIRPDLLLPGQTRNIAGLLTDLSADESPLVRVAH
jgi:2-amino-4-hydroxy-6-hydroxymethyldihydropteridine diphosphokinase